MKLLKSAFIGLAISMIVGSASAQDSWQLKTNEVSRIDYVSHLASNEGMQYSQPIGHVPEGNTLTLLASFSLASLGLILRRRKK